MMPFVEGVGDKAPRSVLITISEQEKRPVKVIASRIAELRGYNKDNTLVGLLGEAALSIYVLEQLNLPYKMNAVIYKEAGVYGDGGVDFTLYGIQGQVKTHRRGQACRIPRFRNRRLVPLLDGYYVFCELVSPERDLPADIALLGFIHSTDCLSKGKVESHGDKWFLVIDPKYLERMDRFVVLAQVQKELEVL